jgi:hypothetical protein
MTPHLRSFISSLRLPVSKHPPHLIPEQSRGKDSLVIEAF